MRLSDEPFASIFNSYEDWLWETQTLATSCLKLLLSCEKAVESSPVGCEVWVTEYATKFKPYLYPIPPINCDRRKMWPKPKGQPAFATQHTSFQLNAHSIMVVRGMGESGNTIFCYEKAKRLFQNISSRPILVCDIISRQQLQPAV